MRILITSTSFQDTPGNHHRLLKSTGYNIVKMRGPLIENEILEVIQDFDAIICGDDFITKKVIKKGANSKLKIISKYGVGLDKIDLIEAKKNNILVTNCEGSNHHTVAEHIFALILSFYKNIFSEVAFTKKGKWKRLIGIEAKGKKIGIVGLGKIGKEVALRSAAFGMEIYVYDKYPDHDFIKNHKLKFYKNMNTLVSNSDIITLCMDLNESNYNFINDTLINDFFKKGVVLVNTSRGHLVDEVAVLNGIENGIIKAYLTDVLREEPMSLNNKLSKNEKVYITPHIASRTYESVERQGIQAVNNVINFFKSN